MMRYIYFEAVFARCSIYEDNSGFDIGIGDEIDLIKVHLILNKM